ncbi:hypothetical protein [Sinorhizobium medicae]
MADKRRLVELSMVPELAKEVANQIESQSGEAIASVATVGTADATDLATAIVLVNALKARLNALITALKA